MRIDLPNGAWAELRDPADVTTRQRRLVEHAGRRLSPGVMNRIQAAAQRLEEAKKAGDEEAVKLATLAASEASADLSPEDQDAFDTIRDYGIVALVENWSFAGSVTLDAVLDLPARAGDELRKATDELIGAMFVDPSPDPNPTAPGGGSNGSATPSTEVPPTTSPTSGEPSAASASD